MRNVWMYVWIDVPESEDWKQITLLSSEFD